MKRASIPDAIPGLPHRPDLLPRDNRRRRFSILNPQFSIRGSAWGLLAGLAGSLCCLGPSAAVLLGLGSSSALFGIQLERPLALAAGAALLLAGIVVALRRERGCAMRRPGLWRQPALMLMSFALAYGLLGLLAPWAAARQEDAASASAALQAAPAVNSPRASTEFRRATLIVEKMICPPCAANVRGLLERKPFVRGFLAEEGNETVVIEYDSRQVDTRKLVSLFPLSFKVTLIGDAPLP
jgi:hypothetical protein